MPQEQMPERMSDDGLPLPECCAHLRVTWRTEQDGRFTIGWWQCELCAAKFAPASSVSALAERVETLQTAFDISVRDRVALREKIIEANDVMEKARPLIALAVQRSAWPSERDKANELLSRISSFLHDGTKGEWK